MPVTAPAVEIALKRVLVATDFSPCSDRALRYALARARSYGATVTLAHVVSSLGYSLAGEDAAIAAEEAVVRDIKQLEDRLTRTGALSGIPHHAIVLRGEVWPQLEHLIEQEQVDLLVIGTHGRTGVRRAIMGSVAENIFRHAICPVLTVGPCVPNRVAESDAKLHSILFATDFGRASIKALPYALSLAQQNQARLVLLHVLSPVPVQEPGALWYAGPEISQMRATAEATTKARLRGLIGQEVETVREVEIAVDFDDPVEGILKAAAWCAADLIVMGVKSASTASVHLPWAIAQQIVGQAECPVLTVRV